MKKIISLFIVFVLAFGLVACSESSDETKSESKKKTSKISSTSSVESKPESTDDAESSLYPEANGTDSEYEITSSQADKLFDNSENDNVDSSDTTAVSSNSFDKDGDGWTDGWR